MNPKKKKVLFLYFELAGYFVACLEKLVELYDVEVHVIRYPVNPVAPFKFENSGTIFYYERKNYDNNQLMELAKKIDPGFIYCSGWMDKGYVEVCKNFKGTIPTILTLDNPWRNTLKQNIASLFGGRYLKKIFSHCWVPGKPQVMYCKKLGFKDEQIKDGMYSADIKLFNQYYEQFREQKAKSFPRRIIYVGRYTKLKGTKELWQAFVELQNEMPNEWELWCLGKGEYDSDFPVHPKIKNIGFVQPKELSKYIEQTGVFILPAYYEHWGVVVHEFAAAGFPLICTTTTSAATKFLKDGYNGFFHAPHSVNAIKEALKKIISLSQEELVIMGDHSHQSGQEITPTTWSDIAMSYFKK